MAMIPKSDPNKSALDGTKIFAITYRYAQQDQFTNERAKFVDTWHIYAEDMGEAMSRADMFLESCIDDGSMDTYKILSIMLIEEGEE